MKDRVVLITGATDGIGRQTAIELAEKGFHVIVHGRNESTANTAMKEIQKISGSSNVSSISADLSSLESVRELASKIISDYSRLDVLVNNAGIYMNKLVYSPEKFEMTFAVNHLSHFLLTNLLLELLGKSDDGRIINVSSIAHQNAKLDWNNLNAEKSFSSYGAYALSKLANVLFSNGLASRLNGTSLKSNSLHPGVITTKLLKTGFNMTGASVKRGAETSVFLSSSESVVSVSGEYFIDCNISKPHPAAVDREVIDRFWSVSEEMTGLN